MNTRIYIVTQGETKKLIEASSQAQALRHVAKDTFTVKVATTTEVAEILTAGGVLEKSAEEMWSCGKLG